MKFFISLLFASSFFIDSSRAQCCPDGAWGELKSQEYVEKGTLEKVGNLEFYRVGNSSKCIIWNYDIFGFDSGRTRQMADFFAAHEYLVIMPDYFRGTFVDPSQSPRDVTLQFLIEQSDWNGQLKQDYLETKDYAQSLGCKTLGSIGFCWGSYPVIRMSEDVAVKAGISMHPSHPNVIKFLEEDEKEIYKEVKSPQMFMPSMSDPDSVKRNGLGHEVMGDVLEVVEFPEMRHGWTVRGDLEDPVVERDVKKAFNLALAFFGKYL